MPPPLARPRPASWHSSEPRHWHPQCLLVSAVLLAAAALPAAATRAAVHGAAGPESARNASTASGLERGRCGGRQLAEEEPAQLAAEGGKLPRKLRTELLRGGADIVYKDLNRVDLRYFQGIGCKGPVCPSFGTCTVDSLKGSAPPPLRACWNPGFVDESPASTAPPINLAARNPSGGEPYTGEPFAGQVFELRNVYVNDRGDVFDAANLYVHLMHCKSVPADFESYEQNRTRVHVYEEAASLAYWSGVNYWHFVVEVLPAYLVLAPVLKLRPNLPISYRNYQELFFHAFDLIGVRPRSLNTHLIPDGELLFAERLFLPVQPRCGFPSKAAVTYMRREFFAGPPERRQPAAHPPPGNSGPRVSAARTSARKLASLARPAVAGAASRLGVAGGPAPEAAGESNADAGGVAWRHGGRPRGSSLDGAAAPGSGGWRQRRVTVAPQGAAPAGEGLGSGRQMLGPGELADCRRWEGGGSRAGRRRLGLLQGSHAAPAYDWLVVLGRRQGSRQLEDNDWLIRQLSALLPPGRLVVFDGNLPLREARALFMRARLFVTPHGAAQANEVMMPPDGAVLEVRPRGYDKAMHHYVAALCGLEYYLLYGNGTKDTPLAANIREVFALAKGIIDTFCMDCR